MAVTLPITYRESELSKPIKMYTLQAFRDTDWILRWKLLENDKPFNLSEYNTCKLVYGVNNSASSVVSGEVTGTIVEAVAGDMEFIVSRLDFISSVTYNFHISIKNNTSGEEIIFPFGEIKIMEMAGYYP